MLFKEDAVRTEHRLGKLHYVFNCITCSREVLIRTGGLKKHKGKCFNCSRKLRPYEWCFRKIERRAKKKGVSYLTYEEWVYFIETNATWITEDGAYVFCTFFKTELLFWPKYSNKRENKRKGIANSDGSNTDRLESNKGYTLDNIVPCGERANTLFMDKINGFATKSRIAAFHVALDLYPDKFFEMTDHRVHACLPTLPVTIISHASTPTDSSPSTSSEAITGEKDIRTSLIAV